MINYENIFKCYHVIYRLKGLDSVNGVGTPMAFILCCIVGLCMMMLDWRFASIIVSLGKLFPISLILF